MWVAAPGLGGVVNAVLNRVMRPRGRRRGTRVFIRVTLADPGKRRRSRWDMTPDEMLGFSPANAWSFL